VIRSAGLLMSVALSAFGTAVAGPPPKLPVEVFFGNPAVSQPRLSDDGKTLALIMSRGDLQVIATRGVADDKVVPVAKFEDPEMRLARLEWASSDRIFISGQLRDRDALGMRSRATRLFGVDRDGRNFGPLGLRWPVFGQSALPVSIQDQILHWTPDDPKTVLIGFRSPFEEQTEVMRMDVDTGALKRVQAGVHGIRQWHADREGRIRAGEAYKDDHYQLWVTQHPDAPLRKVIDRHVLDGNGPTFIGFHADPGLVYVAAPEGGRSALFEFDVVAQRLGKRVFSHPNVDIDDVKRDAGPNGGVVGVRYTVDRPEIHFFDETAEREHKALRAAIQREFPTAVFHEQVSASSGGDLQILEVSSDVQPPIYYLYDRAKRRLARLLDQRPQIDPRKMAPTRRIEFKARDGRAISGYMTLPQGVEPKRLPAIALVHGGPWSRDLIQWDPEVQLLANRGFVVLQINFRGSTGFGTEHLEAGYREWGQKIQDDITDGVRWAIEQGFIDPDRLGIMGASFGGYASLVGLVKTPELFRAGAAYAAVTDIELMISDDKWYDWGVDWHEKLVGGGRGDKTRLGESSPLRRATEIRAPVLLGQGVDDQRVHVRQSRRMAEALSDAGKQVEYLEFPNEVHGFLLEANRIRWYERVVTFFEEHLAPRAPSTSAQ
jgi:dipeptidyl aminopeptidase/acylaminoacyl peptidase